MKCPYCDVEKMTDYTKSGRYCRCGHCGYIFKKDIASEHQCRYHNFLYFHKTITTKTLDLPMVFAEARTKFETENTKVVAIKMEDEFESLKHGKTYYILLRK